MKLLLGCDPEVFVKKAGAKRFHVSAHGMCEGTKDKPVPLSKGAVQVDGMALEFNINPASDINEWMDNIKTTMVEMQDFVPKGHEISIVPVAHFTKKTFDAAPEEAKELGCNPDFSAYTMQPNPRPNADNVTFRTGAGHIHFGWTQGADVKNTRHLDACKILCTALDLTLGLGSLHFDDGVKRRLLYGKPGAFRPKPYGCEYRVLSNAWLKDEKYMTWVYETSVQVFNKLAQGKDSWYRGREVLVSRMYSYKEGFGVAEVRRLFNEACVAFEVTNPAIL